MSAQTERIRNVWLVEEHHKDPNAVLDCDKALEATGYGLFNILLLLAALPIGWTCIIDTTSTAFIINSAECDIELSIFRKGVAMASIYLGMTIAGPIWDFVLKDCVVEHLGKRNAMIIGMLLDAICNVLWAHATSFTMFALLKFISGMLIAGPLSLLMAYLADFHAPTYQPKFSRWAGLLIGLSNIIPAALAATLLSRAWQFKFTIYNRFYPTWRVYLLMCAIPSTLGLLTVCLIPQSPKCLINCGKRREALRLLRIMFSMNNFKSSSEYQINELSRHRKIRKKISLLCKDNWRESISKLKILCSAPNLKAISLILFLQFSSMVGFNVMRLWVPWIFVVLNNFRVLVKPYYPSNEYITMCEMMFPRIEKINYTSCNYTSPSLESAVYVNSTIIATSAVAFGFLFALLTNTKIKKIIVIAFTFVLSAIGSFGANWVIRIPYMLVLLGFVIVASRVTSNGIIAYNTEVMPQLLRATSVNVINLIGNFGAATGNLLFAAILDLHCLGAFLTIGCLALLSSLVSLIGLKRSSDASESQTERC